jgi:GTP-binding protein HflX
MNKEEDGYDKLFEDLLRESARAAADFDADEVDEVDSQQDLSDRHALRRVKSFSTELQDISEAEYRQLQLERVVLVGIWTEGTAEMAENSLEELRALAETAGSEVLEGLIQRRDKPDPSTYIGSGKLEDLKAIVRASGADTVICDGELSPSQLRTLED